LDSELPDEVKSAGPIAPNPEAPRAVFKEDTVLAGALDPSTQPFAGLHRRRYGEGFGERRRGRGKEEEGKQSIRDE
jgi:hypothetical protein